MKVARHINPCNIVPFTMVAQQALIDRVLGGLVRQVLDSWPYLPLWSLWPWHVVPMALPVIFFIVYFIYVSHIKFTTMYASIRM